MRKLKVLGVKGLAVALALAMAPAAVPAGTPLVGASQAQAGEFIYVGDRYYRGDRFYGGDRFYRDRRFSRRGRDRNDLGVGIAGAIIGLGVGAAIASQSRPRYYEPAPRRVYVERPRYYSYAPEPWTAEWYGYCASKYQSFDARSGTYQPYQGRRRLCT